MHRCPKGLVALGLAAALLQLVPATSLAAQAKSGDTKNGDDMAKQVDIVTVDKVELKAKYYPSSRKDAPCVLLLHALGESSSNKEWTKFAKTLQEKGYAVLMFDFRGHGDSTTVQPGIPDKNPQLSKKGFWDELWNQKGVKGYAANKPRPTEIKYEGFATGYYPALCNDIAAAKAFLDDQPDCNSNNLILIGVKDGATMGAIWLNSECFRFRVLGNGPDSRLDREHPEGQAVSACVWISISATLGANKQAHNPGATLEVAGRAYKVPMLFIYGAGDDKGKTLAKNCEKVVTGNDKKGFPYTGSMMIDKAEKATGRELLLDSLETTAKIVDYLESLPPRKKTDAPKKTGDESYRWEFFANGKLQQVSAREPGTKLLKFATYQPWLK